VIFRSAIIRRAKGENAVKKKMIIVEIVLLLAIILGSSLSFAGQFTTTVRNNPWRFDPAGDTYTVSKTDTFVVINGTTGDPATINVFFRDIQANPMSPTYVIAPAATDNLPLLGDRSERYLCATQAGRAIPDSCMVRIRYKEEGPTLSQWGLAVLIALLVASAVFIWLRRRRITVLP
jgi:hypothetical protein